MLHLTIFIWTSSSVLVLYIKDATFRKWALLSSSGEEDSRNCNPTGHLGKNALRPWNVISLLYTKYIRGVT
jgi:hypothetical protein